MTQNFLDGKHVVVFGAGYVGSAVVERAVAAGAKVTALTRNGDVCERLRSIGCRAVQGNLEEAGWHRKIDRADFVLNCVSSGRQGVAGYALSYRQGAQSILRWGQRLGPDGPPLVYTSSTSVYPEGDGREINESSPVGAKDLKGEHLIAAEDTIMAWPQGSTVLRLAGIYGPGRHHLLDQLRTGSTVMAGRGDQTLNLIHLADIVSAVWAAWRTSGTASAVPRVFNVVDDGRATKAEIVSWLAAELGVAMPEFSGKPAPGRRANRPDRIILNSQLKNELGWQPRFATFRDGYASILLDA